MSYVVYRYINGISLNGAEYIMQDDDHSKVKIYATKEEFLTEHNIADEDAMEEDYGLYFGESDDETKNDSAP